MDLNNKMPANSQAAVALVSYVPELTMIEAAVLHGLSEGLQSKEIAEAIGRKRPTVEGYIRALYLKFHAKSRAQLVARAYRCGLLSDES